MLKSKQLSLFSVSGCSVSGLMLVALVCLVEHEFNPVDWKKEATT